jgi:hypothetical protein
MAMLPKLLEQDRKRAGWSVARAAWELGVSVRERFEDFSRSRNATRGLSVCYDAEGVDRRSSRRAGLIAPKIVAAPTRRRPLRDSAQCESATAAVGVETPASLEVAVNELGVLAYRAEDSKCVGRAERHGLPRRVRFHKPERRASGGPKHRPNVYPCLHGSDNQGSEEV